MKETKTLYEWCLIEKVKPTEISDNHNWIRFFYMTQYTYNEFFAASRQLKTVSGIPAPAPRIDLEYKMYGFVPYNLSDKQKMIQFGHAVVEYSRAVEHRQNRNLKALYNKWADVDKTFIVLDGGTTNNNTDKPGSLQKIRAVLEDKGVYTISFQEPDINDATTAFVFLVDERVFNREKYPDYPNPLEYANYAGIPAFDEWAAMIGETNIFLRTYLPPFKLA